MKTRPRLRRCAATIAAVVVAAAVLAGCFDGYDPGMTRRCASTWWPDRPTAYAIQTDCPGDIHAVVASGQFWALGSNAPYGSGHYCGQPGEAYRISGDGSTPLQFDFIGGASSPTAELGIVKDACSSDRAEISLGQMQPGTVPIAGLLMSDSMSLMHAEGIYTAAFHSIVTVDGVQYNLGLDLRPTADDPRWNHPAPCVDYKGPTDRPSVNFIALDASCFGVARMSCNQCAWADVNVNWDAVYSWLFTQHPGWWPQLQAAYPHAQANIRLVLTTFRPNSGSHPRVRVWHKGWLLQHQ